MKCKLLILFVFTMLSSLLWGQEIGKWKTYFAYNQVSEVVKTEDRIFALSEGVLFSVDLSDERVETYTKIDGLTDGDVAHITYVEQTQTLLIAYSNGNIDLLKDGEVHNVSDLKRKDISGKSVNALTPYGKYVYLSCGLGIVVVDTQKEEIADTYVIGDNGNYLAVNNVAFANDSVYALTSKGVKSAPVSSHNLANYENWDVPVFDGISTVEKIASLDNRLCVVANDTVFAIGGGERKCLLATDSFLFVLNVNDGLLINDADTLYRFEKNGGFIEKNSIPSCIAGTFDGSDYWLSLTWGSHYQLFKMNRKGEIGNNYTPDGPEKSSVVFLRYGGGKLFTGSGAKYEVSAEHTPGVLQIYENGEWTVITGADFVGTDVLVTNSVFENVQDALPDPTDPRRFYVASWRSLFEFYDKKPVKQYWYDETPLVNVASQVLVDGLCFDKDNNLWMLNMFAPNGLVVKKADGTWDSFYYSDISNKPTMKETFISENGYLWILCPRTSMTGLGVIDQRGTPFDESDDQYRYFTSFTDGDGNVTTPTAIRCIAEDQNHVIWIGTNAGPFIVNNSKNIFNSTFSFDRIKITREDNENYADYLLGSDRINAIVVDGGNRKWLASSTSGVYLLSADGKETIKHFTTDNSPLTSNTIVDLAMVPETGELFIATASGLFSYTSDSSVGSADYSEVFAYPNPVTPDFDGDIAVRGLVENSLVRIADVEGRVVCEGYSNGGTFSWNGKNRSGKRVATGIYYIFAAQEDGSMKVVTKLAFIH